MAQSGGLGFELHSRRLNLHGLGDLAYLERHVEGRRQVGAQDDVTDHSGTEAGLLDAQHIAARR